MRNTALRTSTTNSRGVKSSFSRMTFHSGGRSILVFVLTRGLVKVGLIGCLRCRTTLDYNAAAAAFARRLLLVFQQLIDAPGAGAGKRQVEEDETIQNRAIAAVEDREEAMRRMAQEIG